MKIIRLSPKQNGFLLFFTIFDEKPFEISVKILIFRNLCYDCNLIREKTSVFVRVGLTI